jgi:hypothetical protein
MKRPATRLMPLAVSLGFLAGCSTMPEWTKPSTWVDGVTDAGKPAEAAPAKPAATQVAAPASTAPAGTSDVFDPLAEVEPTARIQKADAPTAFPEIAAQPAARELTTTESQRREIRDALVADRDNAQYSAEELRGGAAPPAAPPAPKAPANPGRSE